MSEGLVDLDVGRGALPSDPIVRAGGDGGVSEALYTRPMPSSAPPASTTGVFIALAFRTLSVAELYNRMRHVTFTMEKMMASIGTDRCLTVFVMEGVMMVSCRPKRRRQ